MKARLVAVALASLLLVAASPQDVASDVADEIMSPFCPGVTLHDCPSGEADDLRREIVTMAERGMSKEEIIAALEAEYGPLAATPESPFARLLPWAAALVGVIAAGLLASRFAARQRSRPAPPVLSPAQRARVDEELQRFRSEA